MNIDTIIENREELERQLHAALSTLEYSDKIKEIKLKMSENQRVCPHASAKYNWAIIDGVCPYCGFHFDSGRDY